MSCIEDFLLRVVSIFVTFIYFFVSSLCQAMFHFPEFRANNMTTITPLFSYKITISCFEPRPTTRCLRRSKKTNLKNYVFKEQQKLKKKSQIYIIEQLYRNP